MAARRFPVSDLLAVGHPLSRGSGPAGQTGPAATFPVGEGEHCQALGRSGGIARPLFCIERIRFTVGRTGGGCPVNPAFRVPGARNGK